MIEAQSVEELVGSVASLAAGAEQSIGNIHLERVRTCAIVCRATYNASASSGMDIRLFFAHKDTGFDTVPFTSFTLDFAAGETVQKTVLVDFPEGGSVTVKAKNNGVTYAVTNVKVGYVLSRWSKEDER